MVWNKESALSWIKKGLIQVNGIWVPCTEGDNLHLLAMKATKDILRKVLGMVKEFIHGKTSHFIQVICLK